jgi:hypothetical protein
MGRTCPFHEIEGGLMKSTLRIVGFVSFVGFFTAPGSPGGDIPVVKILSASDMTIDGAMDYGEIVHDYLTQNRE